MKSSIYMVKTIDNWQHELKVTFMQKNDIFIALLFIKNTRMSYLLLLWIPSIADDDDVENMTQHEEEEFMCQGSLK